MFPKKSLFFPERNLTSTSRRKGKLSAKKISSWVKMIISGRACCSSFSLPPLNIQRCYLCALFWWMHSKEMWTFDKSSFEHSTNHLGKTKHEIIFIQQNSRHFIYVDVSPSSNLISISTAETGKQVCQLRAMKYEEMTISQACKKLATQIKLQNVTEVVTSAVYDVGTERNQVENVSSSDVSRGWSRSPEVEGK